MSSKASILALCLVCGFWTQAQTNQIPVEVFVERLHHGDISSSNERSTQAVFKFYYDTTIASNLITDKSFTIRSTGEESTIETASDTALKAKSRLKPLIINTSSQKVRLIMETYENDKGEVDEYDKGDDHHFLTPVEVKLSDLTPGVLSDPLMLTSEKEKFSAIIRIRYGLPQPAAIACDKTGVTDVSKPVTLKSAINLTDKRGIAYSWECRIGDAEKWLPLSETTATDSLTITGAKDIFKSPIKHTEQVQLRVKGVTREIGGPYTEPFAILFAPEPPTAATNNIIISPTCPNNTSGSIRIHSFKTEADTLVYYVVAGSPDAGKSPALVSDALKVGHGEIAKRDTVAVKNLASGDYTMVLYNADKTSGGVYTVYPFTIGTHPVLNIKSLEVTHTRCDSTTDGQIAVSIEGGNPDKLTYYIDPPLGKRSIDDMTRKCVFTQLPKGIYSVVIKDECLLDVTKKVVEVSKDSTMISGGISIQIQPKNEAADGAVKIQMNGGSGIYTYSFFSQDVQVKKDEVNSTSWTVDHLPKGNFRLKVRDNVHSCALWDTTLVLKGDSLQHDSTSSLSIVASSPDVKDTIPPVVTEPVAAIVKDVVNAEVKEVVKAAVQETGTAEVRDAVAAVVTEPGATAVKNPGSNEGNGPGAAVADVTPVVIAADNKEPEIIRAPVMEEAPIRRATASFTKTDDRLDFYKTTKKTSVTYAGFSENGEKEKYVLLVEKSKYRLTVIDSRNDTIITYPVVFGNNDQTDKMQEGDRRTPEGTYEIREKREHTEWDKILFINYPNAEDQTLFNERKRKGLIPANARIGDQIAIHGTRAGEDYEIDRGTNWTNGCVATKNKYIDQLYQYISVGTKVIIVK